MRDGSRLYPLYDTPVSPSGLNLIVTRGWVSPGLCRTNPSLYESIWKSLALFEAPVFPGDENSRRYKKLKSIENGRLFFRTKYFGKVFRLNTVYTPICVQHSQFHFCLQNTYFTHNLANDQQPHQRRLIKNVVRERYVKQDITFMRSYTD